MSEAGHPARDRHAADLAALQRELEEMADGREPSAKRQSDRPSCGRGPVLVIRGK